MKGKDGGAAKVLRREWALRRLPRWGRGVRRRVAPLRTVTPLRDSPVLRMAYFTIKPHRGLISKTLMLQVRCAHPTGNFAPKRPFGTFRCSGRLILCKEYTVLFAPKRSTFRFAALTLRVSSHRNIPLECSGVAHGLFYDFAPSSMRTLVFRSAYSTSRNARAPAASRPPSSHTMA